MGHLGRGALGVVVIASALVAAPSALLATASATTGQSPTITLRASHRHLRSGKTDTLLGEVTNAPSGSEVKLYSRPFPYTNAKLIRTVRPGAGGRLSFRVSPHRNTRYSAILTRTAARADTRIWVFDRVQIKVTPLPLGRVGIRIVVHHPPGLHWG